MNVHKKFEEILNYRMQTPGFKVTSEFFINLEKEAVCMQDFHAAAAEVLETSEVLVRPLKIR